MVSQTGDSYSLTGISHETFPTLFGFSTKIKPVSSKSSPDNFTHEMIGARILNIMTIF